MQACILGQKSSGKPVQEGGPAWLLKGGGRGGPGPRADAGGGLLDSFVRGPWVVALRG